MENIIECSICFEKYNTKEKLPRILTCGHTFCTSCLFKIKEKNQPDNLIKCPLDSKIEFDKKTSNNYFTNFHINKSNSNLMSNSNLSKEKLNNII